MLRKQYPDYGFGDISRLVGTEVGYHMRFEDGNSSVSIRSVSLNVPDKFLLSN